MISNSLEQYVVFCTTKTFFDLRCCILLMEMLVKYPSRQKLLIAVNTGDELNAHQVKTNMTQADNCVRTDRKIDVQQTCNYISNNQRELIALLAYKLLVLLSFPSRKNYVYQQLSSLVLALPVIIYLRHRNGTSSRSYFSYLLLIFNKFNSLSFECDSLELQMD